MGNLFITTSPLPCQLDSAITTLAFQSLRQLIRHNPHTYRATIQHTIKAHTTNKPHKLSGRHPHNRANLVNNKVNSDNREGNKEASRVNLVNSKANSDNRVGNLANREGSKEDSRVNLANSNRGDSSVNNRECPNSRLVKHHLLSSHLGKACRHNKEANKVRHNRKRLNSLLSSLSEGDSRSNPQSHNHNSPHNKLLEASQHQFRSKVGSRDKVLPNLLNR